jgi:hypothetical protein
MVRLMDLDLHESRSAGWGVVQGLRHVQAGRTRSVTRHASRKRSAVLREKDLNRRTRQIMCLRELAAGQSASPAQFPQLQQEMWKLGWQAKGPASPRSNRMRTETKLARAAVAAAAAGWTASTNCALELEPQQIEDEERFPNVGVTDTGRWLVVVLIERGTKARVVTAFEADKDLIALYIREKWGKQ